jgi:hypothetical protein
LVKWEEKEEEEEKMIKEEVDSNHNELHTNN